MGQTVQPSAKTSGGCKKMMCSKMKMKNHGKMPGKSSGCTENNCINCPLIYSFTVPSSLLTEYIKHPSGKLFSDLDSNTASGVYQQVWRPPNVS